MDTLIYPKMEMKNGTPANMEIGVEFCCPECNEVLFTDKNEDEAIEFLSNKDKLKELMVKKVIQNGRQKKRSN